MIESAMHKAGKVVARIMPITGRKCCLCGHNVGRFLPYKGGWAEAPPLMRALRMIGSDLNHFECPWCGGNDRERHLLFYLRSLGLLDKMRDSAVLQFAPELRLTAFIEQAGPARHVQADLYPVKTGIEKFDMLAIPSPDETFDFVIANHVLEHVADDLKALSELRRVLKPGGLAILQTPFSNVLEHTISDPGVCTAEARLQLYGQEDHLRLYGRDIFVRFASAGFSSRVVGHRETLPQIDSDRWGINPDEPLFLFERI
jgi:SAM-dependent methyltransferase